jgi:hypothetical protein
MYFFLANAGKIQLFRIQPNRYFKLCWLKMLLHDFIEMPEWVLLLLLRYLFYWIVVSLRKASKKYYKIQKNKTKKKASSTLIINTKRYISIFRISVLLTLSADNTALILVLSTVAKTKNYYNSKRLTLCPTRRHSIQIKLADKRY